MSALARATELAELRYQQGDIAYLELLDVRRGLYQAQIDLVAAQRDALLNTVDLALAVGGGLGEARRAVVRASVIASSYAGLLRRCSVQACESSTAERWVIRVE